MERRTPTSGTGLEQMARVAAQIEEGGVDAIAASTVDDLAAAARAAGVSEVVIGVFADPTEPSIVRERAFMKLVMRIVGDSPTSSSLTLAA